MHRSLTENAAVPAGPGAGAVLDTSPVSSRRFTEQLLIRGRLCRQHNPV